MAHKGNGPLNKEIQLRWRFFDITVVSLHLFIILILKVLLLTTSTGSMVCLHFSPFV